MTSSSTLLRLFTHTIRWNASATIIYHLLYTLHYSMLFRCMNTHEYSSLGFACASAYFIVALGNLGLNETMGPYWPFVIRSRSHFLYGIVTQIVGVSLFTLIIGSGYYWWKVLPGLKGTSLYGMWHLLIVTESIRKPLGYILYLWFYSWQVAAIEVGLIIAYVIGSWVLLPLLGCPLTPFYLFILLVGVSLVATFLLMGCVYVHYCTLPLYSPSLSHFDGIDYSFLRLRNWICQAGRTLCSLNGFVTLLVIYYGDHQRALLTLVSQLINSIFSMSRRVFGISSFVLFTHSSSSLLFEHSLSRAIRSMIVWIAGSIGLWLIFPFISVEGLVLVCFFIAIESIMSIYEGWFLARSAPFIVGGLHIISAAAITVCVLAYFYKIQQPPPFIELMLFIVIGRSAALGLFAVIGKMIWNLIPLSKKITV